MSCSSRTLLPCLFPSLFPMTRHSCDFSEKKKKRTRSKKKKAKNGTIPATGLKQTSPPRVLVSALYPSEYPTGELVPYENTSRTTDEELRYTSRLWDDDFLTDYRQAAEIHRQVRQYAQKELIKPGGTLQSIAEGIEDGIRALSGHQGLDVGDSLKASMGFPTGLCLNKHSRALDSKSGGQRRYLREE